MAKRERGGVFKNVLLSFFLVIALIYALPLFWGQHFVVQISTIDAKNLDQDNLEKIVELLKKSKIDYKKIKINDKGVSIQFQNSENQLAAKNVLDANFNQDYVIALNLESNIPGWLTSIGAKPLKLGLDLQGGTHLLLHVDLKSVLINHLKGDISNISTELQNANIRYRKIDLDQNKVVLLNFSEDRELDKGLSYLKEKFKDYNWEKKSDLILYGSLSTIAQNKINQAILDKSITVIRHRVDELGVSEAYVSQKGDNQIAIDLPGIQDATRAKNILGKTASVDFYLVDDKLDPQTAELKGEIPLGHRQVEYGNKIYLLKEKILSGESIVDAYATFDSQTSKPIVSIRIAGDGVTDFTKKTTQNIKKPIATLYNEIKSQRIGEGKKQKIIYKKEERVINIATIVSSLGREFQITGLENVDEANNLALLLRAGSLPTAITTVAEKTIGPTMGKDNIRQGILSMGIGLALVGLIMTIYYRLFGLLANLSIGVNFIFLIALFSLIEATLTFPGIAGFVLTLCIAVDANVLIFERIREELHLKSSPKLAIYKGFDRAFITVMDSNMTTLIVALLLFSLGEGPIKGFAVTFTLGILTSLVSAILYTRFFIDLIYKKSNLRKISIGIKNYSKS